MPAIGGTNQDEFHIAMNTKTVLPFLCDDFYFMIYKPNFSISFSIGDILIATGMWNLIFGGGGK